MKLDDKRIPSILFAPAERSNPDEIEAQHEKVWGQSLVRTLIDSLPEAAMVLNKHRQIVLANDKLAQRLLGGSRDSLIGMRPGEAVGCIHATERAAGCGTTDFCGYCGAVNVIVNSQHTAQQQMEECRIQCVLDGRAATMDLRVWATLLLIGDEPFTVFAIRDTTNEKRRRVLERLFFHDILNTAGGLSGLLEILPDLAQEEATETTQEARFLAEQLIEEPLARVLGNLIKNALEASKKGQTVTVWAQEGARPNFVIHNESLMSDAVRHQMFQRSFTTKRGVGHGIGTVTDGELSAWHRRVPLYGGGWHDIYCASACAA